MYGFHSFGWLLAMNLQLHFNVHVSVYLRDQSVLAPVHPDMPKKCLP